MESGALIGIGIALRQTGGFPLEGSPLLAWEIRLILVSRLYPSCFCWEASACLDPRVARNPPRISGRLFFHINLVGRNHARL